MCFSSAALIAKPIHYTGETIVMNDSDHDVKNVIDLSLHCALYNTAKIHSAITHVANTYEMLNR
jgi:hypothetical protein